MQVALDLTDLAKAVKLAEDLCRAGARLIEAGTPLIKSWGLFSVQALKRACPEAEVVADLKTMDTGSLEARLARIFGADRATVLAAADFSTIEDFVHEARSLGLKSVVDAISVGVERLIEVLVRVKPDYVLLHIGIDVQSRRGADLSRLIEAASRIRGSGVRVGVAGGINADMARGLRGIVDLVVVGRAIVSAPDPVSAFKEFERIVMA